MNGKLTYTALGIMALTMVLSAAPPSARADLLYSAVAVSDFGSDNQIAYPNTGRKVACGPDGSIYVVYYGPTNGIRVARSTNRGASFLASVPVAAENAECEIAVESNGYVHVAYASGSNLYHSRSTDNGATFSTPEVVATSDGPVHIDVDTPWVYLIPRAGTDLYRNGTSGVGAWSSTALSSSRAYSDVHVDHETGDVIVGTDDPTVRFFVSTDHGATFGTETTPGGSIYYSTTVLAVTAAHRYLYVAGSGSDCLRIDVDAGTGTPLTFGSTTISQGRTLAVDSFNNVIDGYVSGTEVKYAISTDNGETFAPAVTIATADYFSVAINRYYGDIVAIYQTGGQIFANTYGSELLQPPNVITAAVSDIGATTATCGGEVTSDGGSAVSARGVCWSTVANPTLADTHTSDATGTGSFVSALTGLSLGTTYHVRAYASNNSGTAYGADVEFATLAAPVVPTVTTAAVADITTTTATGGGNVTSDGGASVTARGVCWSTSTDPTTADAKTADGTGTGEFASSLTALAPGTPYHVRAYATNDAGTAYGDDVSFTTVVPREPELTVGITAPGATADVGDLLTFQVVVQNTGESPATEVVLTFPLPANAELVSATRIGGETAQSAPLDATVENGVITVPLGSVQPDESAQVALVLRALHAGTVELNGQAACAELDSPVAAQAAVEVTVNDVYVEVVNSIIPLHACGWLGLAPLATFAGLMTLKRRRSWSRR